MSRLVLKRLVDDKMLLGSIFVGIIIATTLVAMLPVYFAALERLALNIDIDRLTRPRSNINVTAFNVVLNPQELQATEQALAATIDRHISHIYDRRERFLVVDTYLAGLPRNPLPPPGTSNRSASRAYFRHYSNLEDHVTVLEGSMAESVVETSARGPIVGAVISPATAEMFDLEVGNVITTTPELGAKTVVFARIDGIVDAVDPREDYWTTRISARVFLDPPAPDEDVEGADVQYDPDEPPVPLFVTQQAMLTAIGETYPGTLIDSEWFVLVDTERLKDWSSKESRRRLEAFDADIRAAIPGSKLSTGITGLLDSFDRRSFFSRVPLLLLMTIMVVTVLFYLSMMVGYLVQSRESDMALLKTRGTGTLQLLRLYTLEGLLLTALGVALAPFLAMAIVAASGTLPYFRPMTDGGLLPVHIGLIPFLLAGGAGVLCLAIFVIPGALGSRSGLLVHKLWSSRPPVVPFFHRYYLDVALLALGGLAFWELQSRGQLVSGGLLKEVEVNETLLLAPVMFLVMVALVFIRFFPLFVRFIGGESPVLAHLLVAASVITLGAGIALREVQEGEASAWLIRVALLAAVSGAYWATNRTESLRLRLALLVVQAVLIGGFVRLAPPEAGEAMLAPTVGLIVLVPAQIAFLLLRASTRVTPVWLLMGIWHMARNPLQYTWLVLLLVLVTGVGLLSTTVGGTLERSQRERVYYEVAADIRARVLEDDLDGGRGALKERSLETPGVAEASLALRTKGRVGPVKVEVLALESGVFPFITWYRDDFSSRPLPEVMRSLKTGALLERIRVPEGATTIGLWVKPEERYSSSISAWIVVEDGAGSVRTVTLGELGPPEWHPLRAAIPSYLRPPVHLVSVQISEPGFGAVLTPGSVLFDDIHTINGPEGAEQVLEDFEGEMRWMQIVTSALSSDLVQSTREDSHGGETAAVFSYGKENVRGIRGFYLRPTAGPVPVVISSSLAAASGVRVGDVFTASIHDRPVQLEAKDIVHYFPTMSSDGGRFLLVDLDNILGHLNVLGGLTIALRPNELFIAEDTSTPKPVRESITTSGIVSGGIRHKATQVESVRQDPLSSAGWSSMVVLSLSVVVLAAAFGYVTYLLLFAHRSRSEMGFLQSLGLSRRQVIGLLGFEHLVIAAIGLGLGTWAGFQMSRLMVSPLAVTERGEPVVPPFILTTDWSMMLPTYAALIAVFLAALFVVNRTILRLDLHEISRAEV